MDCPAPNCTSSRQWVGLRMSARGYATRNPRNITCSIESIRHCLIPSVGDKGRPFLSLIVTIVVLEIIDPPVGECLGVLFFHPQRCSCLNSVIVTIVWFRTMISHRIARKYISQRYYTSPTQAPYRESFPQPQGFHLEISYCWLGEYHLRSYRRTNSRLG